MGNPVRSKRGRFSCSERLDTGNDEESLSVDADVTCCEGSHKSEILKITD